MRPKAEELVRRGTCVRLNNVEDAATALEAAVCCGFRRPGPAHTETGAVFDVRK